MSKKMMILLFISIFLFVSYSGCITESIPDINIDDELFQNAPRDAFQFNSVLLIGDLFIVNVSYGGGCEDHTFDLIATSFMESNPVQVNLVLSHEDYDDPCDMWVTEPLMFDMEPLKTSWQESYQQSSGIILLNLEGWDNQLSYEF